VALALVCSLVGGLVGAGGVYALRGVRLGSSTATVAISDRSEGGVELTSTSVQAGEAMTPAQIYKTYGNAVVCINVSTRQGTGAGTGFIIDGKEGYVLTCYHVVDGAQSISIILNDSTTYSATYVGGDKDQDCAIVKINPKDGEKLNLNSVVLGDSTKLEVGESVCTIGNALGTLANTLTSGTVSALNRSESMEDGTVMNVLQTDTSINSGNSGGPLFNSYGEVIGIVNAKRSSNAFSNTASVEGIAFAIPISDVTAVMDDLMEHGYITGRPQLGITLATITAATAQQYPDMVVGAYVRNVTEGSCSEKAGMKVGDIITSFDGKEVTSSAEVIELKRNHKAGDTVDVVVHRDGDDVALKVTLDEDPDHDNPIDDGSNDSQAQGDQGYGYSYGYGNGDENDGGNGGSYGGSYGFPFSFFGW
jgi:serine protease Do